ncbi:3-methyladenine DNA glycosylase [Citricoccus sp. GCM10030269]|uniref:3-methyladenine DNA glycosylase n=1 Tax=Citricoccus sp. GCM10030269 TaxID=3273388 RepID=UPI003606F6CA
MRSSVAAPAASSVPPVTPVALDQYRVLPADQWLSAAHGHRERMQAYTEPLRELHARGVRHPVHDFLFTYYSHTPGALERWHPGAGVVLSATAGLPDGGGWRFYRWVPPAPGLPDGGWTVDAPAFAEHRSAMLDFAERILGLTAQRPARLACFGLHEWAMAYRSEVHGVRHSTVPLRLGADGTNQVVEHQQIACSHFDAFRFYAPEAAPLNTLQPTRQTQVDLEQPGCLHANMDLYKWAYKLVPAIGSDLLADCFELAWRIRTMDMRASPYELRDWGLEPIRIETPGGRAEYARLQRGFAEEANVLRRRLLDELSALRNLAAAETTESHETTS